MQVSDLIPQFNAIKSVQTELASVQTKLTNLDPANDHDQAKKLGRRYAFLQRVMDTFLLTQTVAENLLAAQELAKEDASFFQEIDKLTKELQECNRDLQKFLTPQDPHDVCDVIMEIKAGTGGEESALFAKDLFRMYARFAESRHWQLKIFANSETGIGGIKNVEFAIANSETNPAPPDGVWAALKYEGGVHRVQRVPTTESSGRIHTSAVGVYVFPQLEEVEEIEISDKDLKIDVFRSSGPGGQSVNTTDSAVRITHLPTGITVNMQNEKSQIQNRATALVILKSRLLALRLEEIAAEESSQRHQQVRTADRSEKIRTYNFPENRIVDHRNGYKAYDLDQVLEGQLQPVIDSLVQFFQN